MKNTLKFIIIAVLIVILFYRVDSAVAMAAEENTKSVVEPEGSWESNDQPEEPGESDDQPENPGESGDQPGNPGESDDQPENPGKPDNQPEEPGKPDNRPEEPGKPDNQPEEPGKPDNQPEEPGEADDLPEESGAAEDLPEELGESADPSEGGAEEIQASLIRPEQADTVSTGPELMKWLNSHKNTGGTVRLLDHVILDQDYSFFPNGINMPSVYVDTDRYTITVTGEIELSGDNHLTFSGNPDGKGIFCVAKKGMLSMQGVAVESGQCALWQEEGGGLVVSSCSVSGDVHYADTPFVMYWKDYLCAVVEKGQTVNEALPSQISCTVNRQGRTYHNELVSVLWSQEGSEKQQEERLRFTLQGSFLNAASAEPPLCTVAYNDYPLTFTEVKASANGHLYTFQGGFTAPEESLPFTVMAEYSFNGEYWILYEEQAVTNADAGFRIDCKREQHVRTARSNIYIRLQWNDNGTRYYSNVLCYSCDNLEVMEDIGGSRGGGTSITNPPDEPQQSIDNSVAEEESGRNESGDIRSDSENAKQEAASATYQTDNGESNSGQNMAANGISAAEPLTGDAGQAMTAGAEAGQGETADTEAGQAKTTGAEAGRAETAGAEAGQGETADTEAGQAKTTGAEAGQAETAAADAGQVKSAHADGIPQNEERTVTVASVYEGSSANLTKVSEQTLCPETHQSRDAIIAAGVVLLSVLTGIIAFSVHSRSGTNR